MNAAKSTKCDLCGRPHITDESRNYGRCRACRERLAEGMTPEAAATASRMAAEEWAAAKIDGQPWWKAGRTAFVGAYPDIDALNVEIPVASAAGYALVSVSVTDGHSDVARTALGFWVAGPLGAAIAHGRSGAAIIALWRSSPSKDAEHKD